MQPSYFNLSSQELKTRASEAWQLLSPCRVCPRSCGADRTKGTRLGFCRMRDKAKVYAAHPHFGEEKPLVGSGGSGTIFFSSCNLACVFCQNWQISQLRLGREVECTELTQMMIDLQDKGCHNINLVSPSIWVPQIIKSLLIARKMGLRIPLVYNTGGYDSIESLKLLCGIIDIYMPDIKYSDSRLARRYSLAPRYWEVVQQAVAEMHRQVGDLVIDKRGLAVKGLLIRHLVLPQDIAGTAKVMKFIASLSRDSYVNIMDQYYPANKAFEFPPLARRITANEFQQALNVARSLGLYRFDRA